MGFSLARSVGPDDDAHELRPTAGFAANEEAPELVGPPDEKWEWREEGKLEPAE